MKHVSRLISVLIYIFIMSFLFHFELGELFHFKQLILVLLGMLLLFLPGYRHGESRLSYVNQLARCALFASYIQTFILLFIAFSTEITKDALMPQIAKNCRPVLYGICLFVIFSHEDDKSEKTKSEEVPHKTHSMSATQIYEAYRKLGLTNREAELAMQIEKGLSNGEIAAELNISETTVKKHISNIFEKLNVNKREQIKEKRKSL